MRLVARQAAQDADTTPTLPVVALTSSDAVNEGDDVIVNKRGTPWFGSAATVVRSSRNQVLTSTANAELTLRRFLAVAVLKALSMCKASLRGIKPELFSR